MTLRDTPSKRNIPQTDSNAATDNLLAENLFKNVQSVPVYQDIDAHTIKIKYYGRTAESSTSRSAVSGLLGKQANSIFAGAKEEIFEDGMESDFSRNLLGFIVSFGHSAMDAIIPIILSDLINTEVASEALRVIGHLNDNTTYRDRLWLLERGLYSASARVRDGATIGLANLNDPLAIEPLKSAVEREPIIELRDDMKQVLYQLEGNKNVITPKKDSQK